MLLNGYKIGNSEFYLINYKLHTYIDYKEE